MRALGVDYGSSRTGLALSDPLGITCSPLSTLAEKDDERLIAKIVETSREQRVDRIVVGLPRPLSGGTNRQSADALAFKERLERAATIPVVMCDERFTSKLAERGRRGSTGKDAVAACYMLQSFLDSCTDVMEDA
jgi:putative holliday junction resolvase